MLFCYYIIIESKLDKFFGYLPNNKTHVLLVLIRNYLYIRYMFNLLIRKFKVHFLSSLLLMSSNAVLSQPNNNLNSGKIFQAD